MPPAAAQELTGYDIATATNAQIKVAYEEVTFEMQLTNGRGQERTRRLHQTTVTAPDGHQKVLLRLLYPAEVRGTGLLIVEQAGRDNDLWLYLPALRRTRRIASGDQQDSFMGSDFAFEDVEPEDIDEYRYARVGQEACGDRACYLVEAVPATEAKSATSAYGRRVLWVDTERFVVLRADYFDETGTMVKQLHASDVRPVGQVDGVDEWRAHRLEMTDVQAGTTTVLTFEDFVVGAPSGHEEVFTLRHLERGR